MQAGVQFKDAWIPACAGMTAGQYTSVLNIIKDNTAIRGGKGLTVAFCFTKLELALNLMRPVKFLFYDFFAGRFS